LAKAKAAAAQSKAVKKKPCACPPGDPLCVCE
jgi:hypothetical protein